MERELRSLRKILEKPEKPCLFILGGAKADDSLKISSYVLNNGIADFVLTGGVVGHVLLVAMGFDLGKQNMALLGDKNFLVLISGIKELMRKYPDKIKNPERFGRRSQWKKKRDFCS